MASKVMGLLDVEELDLDPITRGKLKELLGLCNHLDIEVVCFTYKTARPALALRRGKKQTKMAALNHSSLDLLTDAVRILCDWKDGIDRLEKMQDVVRPIDDVGVNRELMEIYDLAVSINGAFTWNEDGSEVTYGRPVELSWKTAYDNKYPHKGPNCKFKIPEQIKLARKFVQHDADVLDVG